MVDFIGKAKSFIPGASDLSLMPNFGGAVHDADLLVPAGPDSAEVAAAAAALKALPAEVGVAEGIKLALKALAK